VAEAWVKEGVAEYVTEIEEKKEPQKRVKEN